MPGLIENEQVCLRQVVLCIHFQPSKINFSVRFDQFHGKLQAIYFMDLLLILRIGSKSLGWAGHPSHGILKFENKIIAILKFENLGLRAFLNELQGKRDSLNRGPKVRAGGRATRSNL